MTNEPILNLNEVADAVIERIKQAQFSIPTEDKKESKVLTFNGCQILSDSIIGFTEDGNDYKIFLKGGGVAIAHDVSQYAYHQLSEALNENVRNKE